MIEDTEYIRDFLVLHYNGTERNDSPFWDYCRTMAVPERLAEKMRVYHNSGRAFREHDELFNDTSWHAVMNGQLPKPRSYDPVADVLSLEETKRRLEEIRTVVRNSVDYMPLHRDFISRNCAA
jgi:tryptophan halogenase